jgi:glycosyltransferase involved in cell wall biosynthesis
MKALTEAEWTPQIVVCDYAWPAAVVAPLCAGQGIPCAISGRGSDVLQVAGEAGLGAELGAHLNTAGAWFAVSNDLVCAMDTLAGSDSTTRGTLVPNGVDAELFQPLSASDRDAVRREMGWGEDEWIVLLVGHLIPRKDPLLAVRAFAALQSERGAGRAMRLIVIGKGELDQELQGAIEASELSASVELLGERNAQELSRYYAAADCLLLCSKREGRPNVVLEALSSGLPVVATSAGGTAELLDPSPCPPVESRDPSDLAAAMGRVLDDAPSREAVRASVAQYSWDAGLVILERLLQDHVQASSGKIQR